jgi:hypothetical protein
VSALSTGQAQIRPDHLASTWRPTPWRLLASRHRTGPRPINAYVIEHRDGLVLFDAGQDRASVTGPGYFPGDMTGVPFRSCHDLFGDSSLVILPAHDPAAASRLVQAAGQVPTLTTA